MSGSQRQRRSRLTLVEVVIASFLLMIAVLAIISLLVFHIRYSDFLDRRRVALEIATGRVEFLSEIPFNELSAAVENSVRIDYNGALDAQGDYLRDTTIAQHEDGSYLIQVTVTAPGDSMRFEASAGLTTSRAD